VKTATVTKVGQALEVTVDGELLGKIVPTVAYGVPGVRISTSLDWDDQWMPGAGEAVARLCRIAGVRAPRVTKAHHMTSRIRVDGGFRVLSTYAWPDADERVGE